jgi:hypothetical protein
MRGRTRPAAWFLVPAVVGTFLVTAVSPSPAHALTTDLAITGIGGKCMDVDGGSHALGTKVQVWDCRSPSGRWHLVMQADGNLVLNGPSDPYPYSRLPVATQKWDSSGRTYLVMETDGNVVVYAPGALWTSVLWVSGTSCEGASYLRIQDDGNVVIYRDSNGRPTYDRLHWCYDANGSAVWKSNGGGC